MVKKRVINDNSIFINQLVSHNMKKKRKKQDVRDSFQSKHSQKLRRKMYEKKQSKIELNVKHKYKTKIKNFFTLTTL